MQQVPAKQTLKWAWLAFGALLLAYVAFFAQLTALPYQDFPNHLARAVVIADLLFHEGAQFGQVFDFQVLPLPYILGDLLLAGLVELAGPTAAGAMWTLLVLGSLPAALLCYLKALRISRNGQLLAMLLSLYLTTDWFFLLGFMQFRLGLALMILALAIAELLRQRFTAVGYLGYALLIGAAYETHLTAIVFLAPALGITAVLRRAHGLTTIRREILLLLPVLALLGWHFGYVNRVYSEGSDQDYPFEWGGLGWKYWRLPLELLRDHSKTSKILLALFACAVAWGLWRHLRWRNFVQPVILESLALVLAFGGLYLVLPSQYSDASYVDVRALAPLALFALLATLQLRDLQPARRLSFAIPVALVLGIANLAWIANYSREHDEWGRGYREIVASIPRGAYVLPVHTGQMEEDLSPRLHMGSFVVTDRGAVSPRLFSGKSGSHMKYFRYKQALYNPPEFWYGETDGESVEWRAVACHYQYLLVDAPFDAERIAVKTTTVARNESAALLSIDDADAGCRG